MKTRKDLKTRRWEEGRLGNGKKRKQHKGWKVGKWWYVLRMGCKFSRNLGYRKENSEDGKSG